MGTLFRQGPVPPEAALPPVKLSKSEGSLSKAGLRTTGSVISDMHIARRQHEMRDVCSSTSSFIGAKLLYYLRGSPSLEVST